ncbi:TetR/AcrR family transcriptional regulator [Winogradskya humida]|uniref:TetR family transcriptional regulator n=1 Tax=Winogradskya humida TaxID=113566 RepID=A0ABQ4A358_9ACTN|nr:TetR/AcrR family transcriptional regulator [Actinoplanes humidus]GIE25289.1 TetR family transcriptional regulator [Actinoplanes humidus]
MDVEEQRILEVADRLFYARGFHAVAMAEIRTAAAVSLKRLYQLFPAKNELLLAVLDHHDAEWRARLSAYVEAGDGGPLAIFDWLELRVGERGFRGCFRLNVYAELGARSPRVAERVRDHKAYFRAYLEGLTSDGDLADHLMLLFEGATVTAAATGTTAPARQAREAAAQALAEKQRVAYLG